MLFPEFSILPSGSYSAEYVLDNPKSGLLEWKRACDPDKLLLYPILSELGKESVFPATVIKPLLNHTYMNNFRLICNEKPIKRKN